MYGFVTDEMVWAKAQELEEQARRAGPHLDLRRASPARSLRSGVARALMRLSLTLDDSATRGTAEARDVRALGVDDLEAARML